MSSGRVHSAANRKHSSKNNELKPWLVKRWGRGNITGDSIWHMEDILDRYEPPYDPLPPVGCFDARPCQLLGDVLAPIPMQPGQPQREAYE
jgi:hypothetical protein